MHRYLLPLTPSLVDQTTPHLQSSNHLLYIFEKSVHNLLLEHWNARGYEHLMILLEIGKGELLRKFLEVGEKNFAV